MTTRQASTALLESKTQEFEDAHAVTWAAAEGCNEAVMAGQALRKKCADERRAFAMLGGSDDPAAASLVQDLAALEVRLGAAVDKAREATKNVPGPAGCPCCAWKRTLAEPINSLLDCYDEAEALRVSGEEVRSRQHSLVQQADEQLRDMEAVSLRFATLDADLDSLADRASVAFLQLRALGEQKSAENMARLIEEEEAEQRLAKQLGAGHSGKKARRRGDEERTAAERPRAPAVNMKAKAKAQAVKKKKREGPAGLTSGACEAAEDGLQQPHEPGAGCANPKESPAPHQQEQTPPAVDDSCQQLQLDCVRASSPAAADAADVDTEGWVQAESWKDLPEGTLKPADASPGDTRASTQQLPTITSGRAGDHIRESPAPPLQPVYALPPALAHDQALGHEEETTAHVPEEGQQAPSISENVSAGQGVERDLHPGEDCASPLPEPHEDRFPAPAEAPSGMVAGSQDAASTPAQDQLAGNDCNEDMLISALLSSPTKSTRQDGGAPAVPSAAASPAQAGSGASTAAAGMVLDSSIEGSGMSTVGAARSAPSPEAACGQSRSAKESQQRLAPPPLLQLPAAHVTDGRPRCSQQDADLASAPQRRRQLSAGRGNGSGTAQQPRPPPLAAPRVMAAAVVPVAGLRPAWTQRSRAAAASPMAPASGEALCETAARGGLQAKQPPLGGDPPVGHNRQEDMGAQSVKTDPAEDWQPRALQHAGRDDRRAAALLEEARASEPSTAAGKSAESGEVHMGEEMLEGVSQERRAPAAADAEGQRTSGGSILRELFGRVTLKLSTEGGAKSAAPQTPDGSSRPAGKNGEGDVPEACYSPSQQPTATAASTPLVSNLAAQKQSSPLQGAAQQWPYGPSNHCLTWMSQGPASGSIAHATGAAAGGRRTASISNPPRQSQDIRAQAVPNPPRPSQVIRAQALPSQRLIRDLGERGLGRVRGSLPAEPAPSTPSPAARTLGVPALSPPAPQRAGGSIFLRALAATLVHAEPAPTPDRMHTPLAPCRGRILSSSSSSSPAAGSTGVQGVIPAQPPVPHHEEGTSSAASRPISGRGPKAQQATEQGAGGATVAKAEQAAVRGPKASELVVEGPPTHAEKGGVAALGAKTLLVKRARAVPASNAAAASRDAGSQQGMGSKWLPVQHVQASAAITQHAQPGTRADAQLHANDRSASGGTPIRAAPLMYGSLEVLGAGADPVAETANVPSAVSTLLSSLMHPTSPAKQAGGPGAVSWSPSSHGSDEDDGQAFAEGTVAEMLLASMGGTAASRDLLSSLCCPITKDVMEEAVVAADGWSYERAALERRLASGQAVSAVTGEPLRSRALFTNARLQAVIASLLHTHALGQRGARAPRAGPRAAFLLERMGPRARRLLPQLCCPITKDLMRDAVIAADGVTYERKALRRWLAWEDHSPVTLAPQANKAVLPNLRIQALIEQLLRAYGCAGQMLCFAAGSRADRLYTEGGGTAAVHAELHLQLLCPLTLDVAHDAAIAADGFTYNQDAIAGWLAAQHESPVTKKRLRSKRLVPNRTYQAVLDWLGRCC